MKTRGLIGTALALSVSFGAHAQAQDQCQKEPHCSRLLEITDAIMHEGGTPSLWQELNGLITPLPPIPHDQWREGAKQGVIVCGGPRSCEGPAVPAPRR